MNPIAHRRLSRGQAAVELALSTLVLGAMLVVASDFARLFYMSLQVNGAARAGVQYGVQTSATAANLAAMETAALNGAPNLTGMTATASKFCECPSGTVVTCPTGSAPCSDMRIYVEVQTQATFHTLVNYPGIPQSTIVNGTAIMREQ